MSPGRQRTFALLVSVFLLVGAGLGGCALSPLQTGKGVYHEVRKGETLWRICYTYQADMKKVCRVNRIRDPAQIRLGQKIFIPGAETVRAVRTPTAMTDSGAGDKRAVKDRKGAGPSERSAAPAQGPPKAGPSSANLRFIWPVKGHVTSWFGPRKGRPHDGIDIAAPKGTPVLAAEKGKVIYSDNGIAGYGNLIIIQHGGGFHTVYAHNARNRVDVDEQVNRAQVIAEVGDSGRASGYHLHFEIRINERAVDPMAYLP